MNLVFPWACAYCLRMWIGARKYVCTPCACDACSVYVARMSRAWSSTTLFSFPRSSSLPTIDFSPWSLTLLLLNLSKQYLKPRTTSTILTKCSWILFTQLKLNPNKRYYTLKCLPQAPCFEPLAGLYQIHQVWKVGVDDPILTMIDSLKGNLYLLLLLILSLTI